MIRQHQHRLPSRGPTIRKRDYSRRASRGSMILSLDASRAGRRNPDRIGASSATSKALFHARRSTMAAGVGHSSEWPDLCPVYDPHTSPPPNAVVSIVADSTTKHRSPP